MEPIYDMHCRLVCCAVPAKGLISHRFRGERVFIRLPVGGEVVFARDDAATVIRRVSPTQFRVDSFPCEHIDFSSG